jgi:hypothetical protein
MDIFGEKQGSLCIFDRSSKKPWSKKIYQKTKTIDDKTILVYGL